MYKWSSGAVVQALIYLENLTKYTTNEVLKLFHELKCWSLVGTNRSQGTGCLLEHFNMKFESMLSAAGYSLQRARDKLSQTFMEDYTTKQKKQTTHIHKNYKTKCEVHPHVFKCDALKGKKSFMTSQSPVTHFLPATTLSILGQQLIGQQRQRGCLCLAFAQTSQTFLLAVLQHKQHWAWRKACLFVGLHRQTGTT